MFRPRLFDAESDRGDIYLSDPTGDLRIGSIKAGRTADLLATLALVDALGDLSTRRDQPPVGGLAQRDGPLLQGGGDAGQPCGPACG